MPYVEQTEIEALIPADFLKQALDDDGDGEVDAGVWDKIVVAVQDEIDAALSPTYDVPFADPPAPVKAAAKVLALWSLYQRRGFSGAANPWETQATRQRDKLDSIGKGDIALTDDNTGFTEGGVVITEPAKTFDSSGRMMV
jgi:phage gp36-like protein